LIRQILLLILQSSFLNIIIFAIDDDAYWQAWLENVFLHSTLLGAVGGSLAIVLLGWSDYYSLVLKYGWEGLLLISFAVCALVPALWMAMYIGHDLGRFLIAKLLTDK
jgi:hypothetical protein